MSVIDDPESNEPRRRRRPKGSKSSSRKESSDQPKKTKAKPKKSKSPKPPVVINPGPVHELIAAFLLKTAEDLAKSKGVDLKVGDVKPVEEYLKTAQSDNGEGPQPVDVASRVVAHVWARLPGARKLSKRFEGQDNKSGFFSDLAILIAQIGAKNEDIISDKAGETVSSMMGGSGRKARKVGSVVVEDPEPTPAVKNFGSVDPQDDVPTQQ